MDPLPVCLVNTPAGIRLSQAGYCGIIYEDCLDYTGFGHVLDYWRGANHDQGHH
jgi:hypothetical protein